MSSDEDDDDFLPSDLDGDSDSFDDEEEDVGEFDTDYEMYSPGRLENVENDEIMEGDELMNAIDNIRDFGNEDDNLNPLSASTSSSSSESSPSVITIEDSDETSNNVGLGSISVNPTDEPSSNALSELIENHNTFANTSTQVDSENCCIICTEMWTNSEPHHVVSLKCGHLFGKSCIETWLQPSRRNNRCPQCNKPAKKRDIHKIYSRCLKPLDTWERDQALSKLKNMEETVQSLEIELKKSEANAQLLLQENDRLKHELIRSKGKLTNQMQTTVTNNIQGQRSNSDLFQISHFRDIEVREGGCRFQCYVRLIEALVATFTNSNANRNLLFPKYGVKKLPLEVNKPENMLIHNMPIKDMVTNQYDGTLTTVSTDKTLKISSLISKTIIHTVNLANEPWRVQVFPERKDLLFVGFRNGDVIFYDKRNLGTPVISMTSPSKSPVISMNMMEYKNNNETYPAIMSMQLDACMIYKLNSLDDLNHQVIRLPFEGKASSSCFDSESGLSLLSYRPSQRHRNVTHYVLDFVYDDASSNIIPNVVNILEGGQEQLLLSKSKIFSISNKSSALVCAGDESIKGAKLWDSKSSYLQNINMLQPAFDIELIDNRYFSSAPVLSCLSDNMIKLYKIG